MLFFYAGPMSWVLISTTYLLLVVQNLLVIVNHSLLYKVWF